MTEPYSVTMNQPPQYMDSPQPTTAGGMSHYPQYLQQTPVLQTRPGGYALPLNSYGQYSYANGVRFSQGGSRPLSSFKGSPLNAMLPLPGVFLHVQVIKLILTAMHQDGPQNGYGGVPEAIQGNSPQNYDTTDQVAPPGMKPRVTATLWQEEGSMCFQVEAKGVWVARRDGTAHCTQPRWRDVPPHATTNDRLQIIT